MADKQHDPLSDPPPLADSTSSGDSLDPLAEATGIPSGGAKSKSGGDLPTGSESGSSSGDPKSPAKDGEDSPSTLKSLLDKVKGDPALLRNVIGGVVLVVLLAVAAFLYLGDDEEKPQRPRGARGSQGAAGSPTGTPGQPAPGSPGTTPGQNDVAGSASQPGQGSGTPGSDGTGGPIGPEDGPGLGPERGTENAGVGADGETADGQPDEPEGPPPLPENLAEWSKDDYFRARREGSPRLIEAIEYLGANFSGRASVAEGLAALIVPPSEEGAVENGDGTSTGASPGTPYRNPTAGRPGYGGHGNQADDAKVVAALVEALARNDTDVAREALEGMLSGQLEPEDPGAAVEATLTALAQSPSPKNDALLLRVVTAPAQFREPAEEGSAASPRAGGYRGPAGGRGSADLTAQGLAQAALAAIQEHGPSSTRLALARMLARPTTPRAWREQYGEILLQPDPRNLAAQFVFYRADDVGEEIRRQVEEFYTTCGSRALAALLDVEERSGRGGGRVYRAPGGGRQVELTAEEAIRSAKRIWSPVATNAMTDRLERETSLEDQASLVALCATMPIDPVRQRMRTALRRHWDEGPQALSKAGLGESLVTDPALLLAVKTLPRSESSSRAGGRAGGRGVNRSGGGGQRNDMGEQWMDFCGELVQAWCARFQVAAVRQAEAARLRGKRPDEVWSLEQLPIDLHEGAKVTASYARRWPEQLPAELKSAPVGPTSVHYVRIEQRDTMKRMEGFYRLQARQRSSRELGDGRWIDAYRAGEDKDRRVSIDVLITPQEKRNTRDESEDVEEDLTIELLAIEAANPEG